MAVRIGDTLKQINNADFPIVEAMDVAFESGDTLQELYDSGALSGGGGSTAITLTQEEYDALDSQEQLEGEFYCYDSARHFRNGVEYGKAVDISGKQDDLNKIKFTMRRNGVNEPRYCLIGKSDLNQTLLMNEPYIFEGVFGSNTSSDKKSIITLSVSFKNGADRDNIFRGYADCADGFQYVDLVVTVDEENMAYAYVDFKQESSLATGSIRVPSINTEYYMDLETEFELVDSMIGTELCRMSDYVKIITNIDDTQTSTDTVWSSKKTSDEIAKVETELGEKVDYKVVVGDGIRYVEDIVVQDINTWLPNNNSSILINLKKMNGTNYMNFQLLCNKKDSKNWSCIVNGAANELWKIRYVNGVRYIDELATMDKVGINAVTNPPDKDLDNYKTNGRYTVGNWKNYSNAPFTNFNGTFIVLETGAYLTQIAIHRYDGIKTRLFADGAWTSWV